ncbi:MAG: hypothetical protein ABIX46_07940 [Burkholderiaceae bacterium]
MRLTPRGRALEGVLVPLAQEVKQIALAQVARADIAATRRCLLATIDNLARDARGASAPSAPSGT